MRIIGIAGASGAGKTTVAGMLAAILIDHGYTAKLDAFAVRIKQRIRDATDREIDKVRDRETMQSIGASMRGGNRHYFITDLAARNEIGPAVWAGESAEFTPADYLIITDVRYPNEAEFCRRLGLLLFVEGSHKQLSPAASGHESESHLDYLTKTANYTLPKTRSLAALQKEVEVFARRHLLYNERRVGAE